MLRVSFPLGSTTRSGYDCRSVHRIDVLSAPFDDITRALLERQGRRRLLGFMGAAAVGAAAAAAVSLPRKHHRKVLSSSSSLSSLTAASETAAPPQPPPGHAPTAAETVPNTTAAADDDPSVAPLEGWRQDSESVDGNSAAGVPGAAAQADVHPAAGGDDGDGEEPERDEKLGHRQENTEGDEGGAHVVASSSHRARESGGDCSDGARVSATTTTSRGRERDRREEANRWKRNKEKRGGQESDAAAAATAASSDHPRHRGRSSSFASLWSGSSRGAVELQREWRGAERIPHPRSTRRQQHQQQTAAPTGGDGHGGGGAGIDDNDRGHFDGKREWRETEQRRLSTAPTAVGMGSTGVEPEALPVDVRWERRPGRSGVRAGYSHGSGSSARLVGDSLGSSWDSLPTAAAMGRMAMGGSAGGTRRRHNSNARALDGSRGESLQRSLVEAMKVRLSVFRPCSQRFWAIAILLLLCEPSELKKGSVLVIFAQAFRVARG